MTFTKILKNALAIRFDKAFGLDISDHSVEIIELGKVFKFSVASYGRTELEEGVIDNGKILKPEILAEELKNVLKNVKPKKISTNRVVISLPESQVFIKCLTVEAGRESSGLTKDILNEISKSLPLDLDKTYWNFVKKPLADNKKMIIFISVARDIANSYVKLCNSIGLEVVSISSESLGSARALLRKSDQQSLIIDLGSKSTNLSFCDSNDKINMTVTIPVAGDSMTKALSEKLSIEKREAEILKIRKGFIDIEDNSVRPILLPVLKEIILEINNAIKYYEINFAQTIDSIYLIGGSALLPEITAVFEQLLQRRVSVGVPGTNLDLGEISKERFPLFVNVIGLGMIGASGGAKELDILKKMPVSEVNTVDKFDLFKLGYLSKVNILRIVFDNKFVLAILIILIGLVFAFLFQQANRYGAVLALQMNGSCYLSPVLL